MSVMMKDLLNTYKFGENCIIRTLMIISQMVVLKSSYNLGWHDNVKENPVERDEFKGTDEEYEEYCESCAIWVDKK